MAAATPDILVRRGIDRGLVGTIVASAAIHAAALALLMTMPGSFLSGPRKMESYTVDLVAPNVIGGTNLVPGGGVVKAADSKPGPPPLAEPKPPPAEPDPAKPAAQTAVELPKEAVKAPPAPPKAAEPAKPVEPPKPPELPRPVQAAPKPAEPPPPVVVKPPDAKPVAPPKPAPVAAAKPPESKPVDRPSAPQPVVKAVQPAKPAPPPAVKPVPAAKPPSVEAQGRAAEPPATETAAQQAARKRDAEIAAAVRRRAAQVHFGAGGASQSVDQQIAAAVQHRAQQVGQGAGSGPPGAGGPVSSGPGSGSGGTPADLQYILYQGKMEERIKAAWAWAGADKTLHAVVQFNLTPDGEIKNVRTIESSGDHQYDASCERAVRVVTPLDPVPEKYRKEFATVEMTFKPSDLGH